MVSKLRNGDYCPDSTGGFCQVTGEEEALERARFLLTARRGSFPFLPDLGSRLWMLGRSRPSARQAVAAGYVAEALADSGLPPTQVQWQEETGRLTVTLEEGDLSMDLPV